MYSRIAGTGSYLPEKVVSNFDLEKIMDTTDEWIRTRTGIERRHIAAEGQTTVDLAEMAARRAIEAAGGSVKLAIVMAKSGVGKAEAEGLLAEAGGFVRRAVGDPPPVE